MLLQDVLRNTKHDYCAHLSAFTGGFCRVINPTEPETRLYCAIIPIKSFDSCVLSKLNFVTSVQLSQPLAQLPPSPPQISSVSGGQNCFTDGRPHLDRRGKAHRLSGRMRELHIYPEVALAAVLDVNETTAKLTLDGMNDNNRYLNNS